jgi:hypothetical protein
LDGALAKSPSDRPARALELATSIARAAGVPEPTLTASGTFKTIPGTGRERPVQNRGAFASANGPNSDHSTPTGAPSRTPYLLAGGGGLLLAMLIIILAIAYGTRGGGSTAAATPAGSLGTAVAAVVPTATVGAVSALAATVPPPTPPPTVVPQTPPPAPVVPPGDYRRVQNTGTDRCLRGRAQPTTNAPIWVCAVDQFVVRIIDGPRRADGYDWYNAEGIGWMAGDDLRGGLFLGSTGVPSPPALQFGCLDLAFRVTTDGNFRPPAVLHSELAFKGAQFEAADGTFAGWLFGDQLFLKYRATVGGREGTGTVVASVTGTTVRGQFVATSFSAGSGAVGTVNGIATPICGYGD